MDQKKKKKKKKTLKDMKEEINDFHILALLLQFLIICHTVFWCWWAAVMWSGCEKVKGQVRVRM